MKIIMSKPTTEMLDRKWALTIGNFDGVHLGHQQIIAETKKAAGEYGADGVAVMTFDPHPVAILHPEKAPGILMPLELKERLLDEAGVDALIVLKDSYELLNLSPEGFVDEFLLKTISPAVVVEGPNFNFGYGRSGDVGTLTELGKARGFEVVLVPPRRMDMGDGESVMCSSSLIRGLIEKGSVGEASEILSRPYRLIGETVEGRGIGRTLGFPTANIHPTDQIIPAEGVYAGRVSIGSDLQSGAVANDSLDAVFSIGRAKTFVSDHPLLIEAHILADEVGDLYGKFLAMDFVGKIRHQQRFENHEELSTQIAKDCERAKEMLADFHK